MITFKTNLTDEQVKALRSFSPVAWEIKYIVENGVVTELNPPIPLKLIHYESNLLTVIDSVEPGIMPPN